MLLFCDALTLAMHQLTLVVTHSPDTQHASGAEGPQQVLSCFQPSVLRITFAAPLFRLPRQPDHPISGTRFSRPNTRHPSSAVMSVSGTFPNNKDSTPAEVQLVSGSRMTNITPTGSNRGGECSLAPGPPVSSLRQTGHQL